MLRLLSDIEFTVGAAELLLYENRFGELSSTLYLPPYNPTLLGPFNVHWC